MNATLPAYAFPYQSPSSNAHRDDRGAEFRGDDGGSITVAIERGEAGTVYLSTTRSGFGENQFTRPELGKVLELATILFHSLK
jgi:hypothetical protein